MEANSSATSPATITVSMLQNTGYLPNAFGATDPYGQTWQVQVLQPAPGQLQALVLTQGGTQIGQTQAPMIAAQAGAQGGFVPYNGQYGTLNSSIAQGAYSGWQVSLSNYANPGPGHLAALLYFNNGNLQNDYLYRVAVPGQPQLNTMQTNLNMGNNSVNNANEVNAQSETLAGGTPNGQAGSLQIGSNYYYGDSTNAAVRTPGGFYIQNQNASGPADISEVNNIYAANQIHAMGTSNADLPPGWGGGMTTWDLYANGTIGSGPPGQQPQAWMNDFANGGFGNGGQFDVNTPSNGSYIYGTNGYLTASDTLTAGSRVILGTAFGSANIGWGCSPNGEIAANANGSGQILACQGGTWQAMGGGAGPVEVQQFAAGTGPIPGYWQLCAAETEVNEIGGIGISGGPYNINGSYFYTWYQNSSRPNGGGVGQYVCENWAYP